ncbi:hypothetical protein [uncultured Marinobacter sp.]|uniref:hypothetical protein n=1 Tax=uncultured Marinobacter sp. TaxID=187379 RepID=UPI0025D90656|nr:hypothetical protein [uncultured Marinobacter sp.]
MQIPTRVREGVQLLAEDALIVIGVSLAIVGVVELSGWSSKEIVQDYTPLLLAMFSILVTVTALRLNIKEGRDRAKQERDQGVRPVLIAKAVNYDHRQKVFGTRRDFQLMRCFWNMPNGPNVTTLSMSVENAGLGVALNVNVFLVCENGDFYKATSEIDKIAVGELAFLQISYCLPSRVKRVITNPIDIFDNEHHCKHHFFGKDHESSDQLIESNHYISELSEAENRALTKALSLDPLTPENSIGREVVNH